MSRPPFPFGFGLGYTTFDLSPAGVSGSPAAGVTIGVDVADTGERAGSEVVQVYVEPVDGDWPRQMHHLAAFRRVAVAAGASGRVDLTVPPPVPRGREGDRGTGRVLVGRSSAELAEAALID